VVDNLGINRRTDDQLEVIFCETGNWAVHGQQEVILCIAASLRRALDGAADCSASGAVVESLSHLPSDDIIVLPDQIDRLRKIIAVREAAPTKETKY